MNLYIYVYEKDRNLIVYFKIMDYKYKFDKNPTNVLASVDDIMEAYATIVDPNGYELTRQYGEVIDDEIKFIVTNDLVDELDELGTYRLQFHIKCEHSEFTIPEISFKVLERLKGFRTVTDEGEVGDEILNNSESFVDAEGKLHLVWREGDTISSVRLNQMVEVVNNAVDEEHQRQINEVNRENRANAKLEELETRFSALTTSQQQAAEVVDARDGEASLKARLDRDVKKPLEYYGNVEGSYISTDSNAGYLKDVEILGNTIQNEDNLADIRSVGDKVEGQELYEIPVLSRGKNLNSSSIKRGNINANTGIEESGANTMLCTENFIRANSETRYVVSSNISIGSILLMSYDEDKKYLGYSNVSNGYLETKIGTKYVKFRFTKSPGAEFTDLEVSSIKVQLEEGTVATPYEPCQEDELTILSPVQIEKVGDVADRIICRDGVWVVEKNIGNIILNGSESWASGYNLINNSGFYTFIPDIIEGNSPPIISNNFIHKLLDVSVDDEFIRAITPGGKTHLLIKIEKSKLSTQDVSGFKQWLQSNNVLVKYLLATPQFIPLPHDQQVKLRTFANKTNISFLTEIEGTIKAQVPKSLGATVNTHTTQISNLNKELDRVKKLEESTVSTVETESDFTTVEATSNGYFEDVKLEGKTLVNLFRFKEFRILNGVNLYAYSKDNGNNNITSNKTFTFRNNTNKRIILDIQENDTWKRSVILDANKQTIVTTTITEYVTAIYGQNSQGWDVNSNSHKQELKNSCILLEGDHTQNQPSYFEGLKSVGQSASGDGADEIVVSSVKGDGNLFDKDTITENTHLNKTTGELVSSSDFYTSNFIPCVKGQSYIHNRGEGTVICFYTKDYTFLSYVEVSSKFTSNINGYFRIHCKYAIKPVDEFIVCKNNIPSRYTYYQSDKKRLLYYNNETQIWEKPILREWDSIEKHTNGKYYYHQRSGEVLLNGSENEKWVMVVDTNTIRFGISNNLINPIIKRNNTDIMCDKINVKSNYNLDEEGIFINTIDISSHAVYIRILKSKLSTQDVAGFKQWLQANNVTVVYQLAQEKVYECTNIDLITYANETNYIVEAGAITPKSTLKVHSNIANVINALQKKVSVLESNYVTLFNTITAAFNSLE